MISRNCLNDWGERGWNMADTKLTKNWALLGWEWVGKD